MVRFGRALWRSSLQLAQTWTPRAGCLGQCPDGFWSKDTPQPFWAICASTLCHPHGKEVLPGVQRETLIFQLMPTAFCAGTGQYPDSVFIASSLQIFLYILRSSQSLLFSRMISYSSLSLSSKSPVSSASWWTSAELFPVCPGFSSPWGLRTGHCAPGTQWCWVEGKDHLSRPTGYTLPNLAKNTVSLLSGKDTLLASVQPGVYQDSSVLSCRANFQLGWPSACITLLTLDHPTTNVLMICLSEVFTRYDCTLDKCSLQLPIFKIKLFSVHQKPVSEMGLSFSWELLHVAPDIFTVFLTHFPVKWKMLVWAAR